MEQQSQLLVYKASAGSGKTFTLAVQYIRLLIEDPHAYRKILAVTFTNKATAEMKERILSQLYGIATGDDDSNRYMTEIINSSHYDEPTIRRRAKEALSYIIHDYSRFRIETIDSFFQSVMRNLARELELGTNLSIELNNMDVLSDAVDAMIEKLNRKSPVLYWLLEYIEERISDGCRWNVAGEIKNFGRNIFDESYIERGKNLRQKLINPQFIPTYRKELQGIRDEILENMKGFYDQFMGLLEMNGLKPEDLKNGAKGISSYFNKIANGNLSEKVRNTTVEKCLKEEENWVSKTSKHRDLIISLAHSDLIPLLSDSEKLRPINNRLLNSCSLSLRYLNNLRLLSNIDEEVRMQNQIHNRFLLSDTNALLHNLIREGDASFIYEKIGTTIDTVMIDEFQDTSRMQWENFRLLLEESLSQKDGSLIVGDVKQSIYRWRNGDWKILADLPHDLHFRIKEKNLENNWRSEANIIHFNNAFFTSACRVLSSRYEQEMQKPCQPLIQAYNDVCQHTVKKTELGYVKISFLDNETKADYVEATLYQLAAEVDSLINQGIRADEIAILVRKNKSIPAIADYFDKHTAHRIVSDEAFRLDASLAICIMIDALRFLVYPDDRISMAQLAMAFQKEVLKKDIDLNTILLNQIEDYLPAGFILQIKELRLMPLYELLEKLFQLFDLKEIQDQDAYLCAFYDAITEYMQANSSELTAFLNYWDEKLHEKTIPSGEIDGIRILSIHKSKGLEYHTVLLPFCDWQMENETNNHLIWCSVAGTGEGTDIPPFNQLDIVPVNYSNAMAESIYQNSYFDERLQLWIDNLNLLYVAFTRACKNLIIWGQKGQSRNVSELLYEALSRLDGITMKQTSGKAGVAGDSDETDEVYEYGSLCLSEPKKTSRSQNRLLMQPEAIPVHIESLLTSIEFKQSNRSADFMQGSDEEEQRKQYIRQGQLLHYVFASIEKEGDLPGVLERLLFEGVLESEEQEKEIQKLAAWALQNPMVKKWYNDDWKLYNECSILYTDAEGNMQVRRPDRVMMKGDETIVVDFKFGKKKEEYHTQVREYISLLNEMGHPNVKGYLWYVFANELILV